ncbi:hypothetical protein Plhal304r1_c011g0043401 [Plasmopara halstedii]
MFAGNNALVTNSRPWFPECCFLPINKDVLLHLAILGGKAFPSYYNYTIDKRYSTKCVFAKATKFSMHENFNAVSDDYKSFEDMVAHAIFFFFTAKCCVWKKVEMHCRSTNRSMSVSKSYEGYAEDCTNVSKRIIPFLAPPNAKWPPKFISINRNGCRNGHLVRACNTERCDFKYWNKDVDISVMRAIIHGLNQEWHDYVHPDIGCVKVSHRDGGVDWIFQPNRNNRKRRVVLVETCNKLE